MSACACFAQSQVVPAQAKESALKFSLDVREFGDATVLYCRGRLVYRDEAAAFSSCVAQVLSPGHRVVLDLSGVDALDSAGLGELVAVFQLGKKQGSEISLAAPRKHILRVLQLTQLTSLFEIHAEVEDALMAAAGRPS